MELNHLKYFYTVAKEGGFTKASLVLKVAQPSISKLVNQLEEELGFELFEKVGRTVRLTKEGGDVYRHCEVIFSEVGRIKERTLQKADSAGGPLVFGGSEAVVSHLVPGVLKRLLSQFPKVVPTALVAPASDLLNRVIHRQLEFGLFLHTPDLTNEVEVKLRFSTPHRVIIAKDKAKDKTVKARFIGSREVDDTSSKSFPTLRRIQKEVPSASIVISTNSITAQISLVKKGMGTAVMPLFAVQEELKKGTVKCLYEDENFEWPMNVVVRRDRMLSRNAEVFLESLEAELSERA